MLCVAEVSRLDVHTILAAQTGHVVRVGQLGHEVDNGPALVLEVVNHGQCRQYLNSERLLLIVHGRTSVTS